MEDRSELIDALGKTEAILTAFVGSIPEEDLDRRRGEGAWTIAEHLRHLAEVQPMLMERLRRFTEESHPTFTPYIPSETEKDLPEQPKIDVDVVLEKFGVWRRQQVELLEGLDPGIWERTADHPEYREYSLYILARHILMHDHWHMYRMEELWLTRDEYLTALSG